ncbi:hypothetical protein Dimus_039396 [Dionaea muscipula]
MQSKDTKNQLISARRAAQELEKASTNASSGEPQGTHNSSASILNLLKMSNNVRNRIVLPKRGHIEIESQVKKDASRNKVPVRLNPLESQIVASFPNAPRDHTADGMPQCLEVFSLQHPCPPREKTSKRTRKNPKKAPPRKASGPYVPNIFAMNKKVGHILLPIIAKSTQQHDIMR